MPRSQEKSLAKPYRELTDQQRGEMHTKFERFLKSIETELDETGIGIFPRLCTLRIGNGDEQFFAEIVTETEGDASVLRERFQERMVESLGVRCRIVHLSACFD